MRRNPVGHALYYILDGQMAKIKSQIRQASGYPYDPEALKLRLEDLINGRFQWHQQVVTSKKTSLAPDKQFTFTVDDSIPVKELTTNFDRSPFKGWSEKIDSLKITHGKRRLTGKLFSLLPRELPETLAFRLGKEGFRIANEREFITFVIKKRDACVGLRAFCGKLLQTNYGGGSQYLQFSLRDGGHSSLIEYSWSGFCWDMRSACLGIKISK
jgi:hypothetical protein